MASFQKPPYRAANLDSTGTLESEADDPIDRSCPSCLTSDEGWPSPLELTRVARAAAQAEPAHLDPESQTLEQGEAIPSSRLIPPHAESSPQEHHGLDFNARGDLVAAQSPSPGKGLSALLL